MLTTSVALCCLARCGTLNAAISARGMQQIGLLFALEPGLAALYPSGAQRRAAFDRHAGHSNTHPYMMPLYLGITLFLERQVAAGIITGDMLTATCRTLSTTLSAIGDGFFEGALLPCWAVLCVCLVLQGYVLGAFFLTLAFIGAMVAFRIGSFLYGLRHGVAALAWLKRLALINWAGRLKIVNALLLVVLFALTPWQEHTRPWLLCAPALICAVAAYYFPEAFRLPRTLLWLTTLVVLVILRILGQVV